MQPASAFFGRYQVMIKLVCMCIIYCCCWQYLSDMTSFGQAVLIFIYIFGVAVWGRAHILLILFLLNWVGSSI